MMASGDIYSIGIALIALAVLLIAAAVPAFLLTGKRLKRRLESEYGETSRAAARGVERRNKRRLKPH